MRKLFIILLSASFLFPIFANAQATDTTAAAATTDTSATTGATATGASTPYQYQRQGIFDCNQNGAYAMSVGALSAIGGAYVPVADAAVELNTGTLVYKECVLREVVDRESESAGTALTKQATVAILSGRNGNPQFVVNQNQELLTGASDPTELTFLQDTALWNTVHPDLQGPIKRALAQYYEGERSGLQAISLKCPYKGSITAFQSGQSFDPNNYLMDFFNASAPQCNPITEMAFAQSISEARIARAIDNQRTQWDWGRGYYARVDQDGNVVTPSANVQASYQTQLDSSVHRLENANDIGQMIGALYAGINTQIIGDQNGLKGLTQSAGGQPSYLDQVARESAQGLQTAAANAALQILSASQQVESAYYQAVSSIVGSLTQTTQQLRTAESQCWVTVISNVCATPLKADNTCTAVAGPCTTDVDGTTSCPTGPTLKVATSTAFSQAVISSQITPLVGPATTNRTTSQQALQIISNLIQGITNVSSLDAQRVALQQLDTLVAQHKLHTQTDLTTITQQQSSVADSMASLLQRVAQAWGGTGTSGSGSIAWDGTVNPGNGWCNVNNQATIQAWIQTWKK